MAAALPASHLAQLEQDVTATDNVCVVCGALIEAPRAELVVLHDDRVMLARLAHAGCAPSGVYAWEGTSEAVAGLTLRPDGLDVATALVWRRVTRPRAVVLVEPRIHVSLDAGDDDPLQTLFAEPLGLSEAAGALDELDPPAAPGCAITPAGDGLLVRSETLRITVPARAETVGRWLDHVDGGRALVVLGRGLGLTGPDAELPGRVAEALALRPCWAASVTVPAI